MFNQVNIKPTFWTWVPPRNNKTKHNFYDAIDHIRKSMVINYIIHTIYTKIHTIIHGFIALSTRFNQYLFLLHHWNQYCWSWSSQIDWIQYNWAILFGILMFYFCYDYHQIDFLWNWFFIKSWTKNRAKNLPGSKIKVKWFCIVGEWFQLPIHYCLSV